MEKQASAAAIADRAARDAAAAGVVARPRSRANQEGNNKLIVEPQGVFSLTAGSLAVSDFRHDFWTKVSKKQKKDIKDKERPEGWWTKTLEGIIKTLPPCPTWNARTHVGKPAEPGEKQCDGAGGGGYRRVEDKKGMEEFLGIPWRIYPPTAKYSREEDRGEVVTKDMPEAEKQSG